MLLNGIQKQFQVGIEPKAKYRAQKSSRISFHIITAVLVCDTWLSFSNENESLKWGMNLIQVVWPMALPDPGAKIEVIGGQTGCKELLKINMKELLFHFLNKQQDSAADCHIRQFDFQSRHPTSTVLCIAALRKPAKFSNLIPLVKKENKLLVNKGGVQ